MIIVLIVGLIKETLNKNESILRNFGGNINAKVDLYNFATKADLKNVTHVVTSIFTLKTNLANLKTMIN